MTADKDDFDIPAVESDLVSTGAAADSADENLFNGLPRILRYALLVMDNTANHLDKRLIAEINELCPDLPENAAWSEDLHIGVGLKLATTLDRLAVVRDESSLRSLADCVRLLSLPTPIDITHFDDHRRVAKAIQQASRKLNPDDEELCGKIEQFASGWAALPASSDMVSRHQLAAFNAPILGRQMAQYRISAAKAEVNRWLIEEHRTRQQDHDEKEFADKSKAAGVSEPAPIPEHHLVVARLADVAVKNTRLKEIMTPLQSVINVALPLAKAPPLHEARQELLREFPYAADVIDFALADLVGRATVHLRPLLLVGEPGGGKSRFAQRLAEVLLGAIDAVWRTDASRSDGAIFAGTDRRWHSVEPCHPFLAIARSKVANPFVIIEEVEKSGTRSDYGRLWDCLLAFTEPVSSSRYPDPALMTNIDLSAVSYVATANSLDPLPSAFLDRWRVVTFPKPTAGDLDALLPAVMTDLVKERGLDPSWVLPLDGIERDAVAHSWRGGSVRRLRRIVEVVLKSRDARATRN